MTYWVCSVPALTAVSVPLARTEPAWPLTHSTVISPSGSGISTLAARGKLT